MRTHFCGAWEQDFPMLAGRRAALLLGLVVLVTPALGRNDGRYDASPLKSRFESLQSELGKCCTDADAYIVPDADWESDHGVTASMLVSAGTLRRVNEGTVADQNDLLRDNVGSCDRIPSRHHRQIPYDVQSHLAAHSRPHMSRRPSSSSDPRLAFCRAAPTRRRAS